MREAYNECVPLLTAYSSELGQNAALHAGYAHVLKHEGGPLDPAQRKVVENALRDFRLAGVDLPAGAQDPLPRSRAAAGAARHQILRERARCRRAPIRAASPTSRSSRDCPPTPSIEPPPMRARRSQAGWLFKLDQPTYMTIMTSAESEQLRRDIYEAWVTRASELGPVRRPLRQQSHHRGNTRRCATSSRSCWVSRISPTMRWPRAWRRAASRCSASWTIWRGAAARPRARSSRISRSSRGASSKPGTWRSSASGCRRAASRCRRRRCGLISRCPRSCPGCSR